MENETEAYIKAVAAGVGVAPNQPIDLGNIRTLIALTTGIIKHENGGVPYSPQVIARWRTEGAGVTDIRVKLLVYGLAVIALLGIGFAAAWSWQANVYR